MGNRGAERKTLPDDDHNIDNKLAEIEQIQLKIGTFDYGIVESPFEFASSFSNSEKGSEELESLQSLFKDEFQRIMGVSFSGEYQWNIGSLDRHLKKGRYSPLYNKKVGVIKNKFFVNRQEFSTLWEQSFKKIIKEVDYLTTYPQFESQKNNLLKMDWIFYRTIVRYCYSSPQSQPLSFQKIISTFSAHKYLIYLQSKFKSDIINEKLKIHKLLSMLSKNKIDILFLQEINAKILDVISKNTNQYRIASSSSSSCAILISWSAHRRICGKEVYPLWVYNRIHINPNHQVLPEIPQLKLKNKKNTKMRDTFFYQQKFLSMKQSETESPVKIFSNEEKDYCEYNPQSNTGTGGGAGGGLSLGTIDATVKQHNNFMKMEEVVVLQDNIEQVQSEESSSLDQNIMDDYVVPNIREILLSIENRHKAFKQTSKIIDQVDIQNHYIPDKLARSLNWNGDTFVQFLGQFIFISGTLGRHHMRKNEAMTSKIQNQFEKMREIIQQLRQKFKKYIIVVGIDANRQWQPLNNFYSAPEIKQGKKIPSTVYMKRTLLQSEIRFAHQEYKASEDFIISNIPVLNSQIVDIKYEDVEENPFLIPCESHPYDHFLSLGTIKYRKEKTVSA